MKLRLTSIILGLAILFTPFSAKAFGFGLPFGGLVTSVIPCTCSGGVWISYTPLFLGSNIPTVGSLYFSPVSILYAWFQLGVPGTWNLGSFLPGPGACLIIVGEACSPLPAEGTIEYMGTSKLF